ncbi:MAG: hypothetical protein HOI95_12020 [Chromatiales bacterium]|jgi:choline dehydrogenase|nr:hypothetical protein [Chromatiales bacterium]
MTETFDYIVLGAGSAGCVLANRLSERREHRVLILEAGGMDHHIWLKIPIGVGKVMSDDRYSWNLKTAPEAGLNGRSVLWNHGRVIGGSSSINGMFFVRGEPAQYDAWSQQGSPGWSHKELLPYLKKLERCDFGDPATRGKDGPMPVHKMVTDDPVSGAFIDACQEAGLPFNDDYNDGVCEGVARNQFNTRNGRRWSTATAYLKPALKRSNLKLETNALVNRVVIENGRAVGVEYQVDGRTITARADSEVIVSCGALHSPLVLEHSGIGNRARLEAAGITAIHHLPGVGENLRDHTHVRLQFETTVATTANDLFTNRWFAIKQAVRYALFREGLFRTPTLKVTGFVRSPHATTFPDVRIQLALASGLSRDPRDGLDPFPGFNLGSYDIYPTSTGSVHIVSSDPRAAPQMNANYFAQERDLAVNLWAMKFNRALVEQPSLKAITVRETSPGPEVVTDDELTEFMRNTAQTSWHPVGSCKMGDGPMAVVDAQLRVHGISGLRVADASVMPIHVSSNTNIPSITVGEKAADLVLGNRR